MKKFKKFLTILFVSMILLSTKLSYATETQEDTAQQIGGLKYICIGVGIILVLLVLIISYKSDKAQEEDERKLEEDDEYNEEDNEYDDIKTEDEQSLYESFNFEKNNEEEVKDDEIHYEQETSNEDDNDNDEDESVDENIGGLKLDEIFDDKIPDSFNNEFAEDSKLDTFSSVETEKENTGISLEDDFLMQMNKNLGLGDEENVEKSNEKDEKKIVDSKKEKASTKKSTSQKTSKEKSSGKTTKSTTKSKKNTTTSNKKKKTK
jgi:hypothetical protein